MNKMKVTGWSILCLYAISLFLIFRFDLLGSWHSDKLSINLFTICSLIIPSVAWYMIRKGKSRVG